MRVRDAPEPSDVLYENIQLDAKNRFGRSLGTGVVKYTVLLIGFAIISFAAGLAIKYKITSNTSGKVCNACEYNANLQMSDAAEDLYKYCFMNKQARPDGTSCGDFGPCYG